MPGLTPADILEHLRSLSDDVPDPDPVSKRSSEWAEAWGISKMGALTLLKRGIEGGAVVIERKKYRNANGQAHAAIHYRFKATKK